MGDGLPWPGANGATLTLPIKVTWQPAAARRRRWPRRLAVAVGAVLVLAGAAVLTLHPRVAHPFRTGEAQPVAKPPPALTAAAPLDARRELGFEMLEGVDQVTVTGADLGGDLYRASAPAGAGQPVVVDSADHLTLRLARAAPTRHASVEIRLSNRVLWRLKLAGGAGEQRVDMTAAGLSGLAVGGGAARIELALPRPRGTVPVRLTSGAGTVALRQPTGVPARVRMAGGAGSVRLDSTAVSGVAAGVTFTAKDWSRHADRYDIEVAAGVSALSLSHFPGP